MSEFITWLALGLWTAAVSLRVHPRSHRWAPRGIAGGWAARYAAAPPAPVTGTPTLPVPREEDDAESPLPDGLDEERLRRSVSPAGRVSA